MQRKRTKDFYQSSVELGTAILPSVRMRKMSAKKLLKYAILIVIGIIVYSIYQKYQMAGSASEESRDAYRILEDKEDEPIDDNGDVELPQRVKEHINRVFEDLREKQEQPLNDDPKQDVFGEFNALNGLADDVDENANVDEVFGEEDKNVDLNEIPDDVFEPIDEAKEKEELEIEKEIEELLAEAFKEEAQVKEQEAKEAPVINEVVQPQAIDFDKELNEKLAKADKLNLPEGHQEAHGHLFKHIKPGEQLRPIKLKGINEIIAKHNAKEDDDHEFPPFVTAVRQTTFNEVMQLVASVQQHMPGRRVYIYDLDLEKDQKKQLMAICGVRMRLFMKKIFPSFVSDLDKLYWKPLVMQTAVAEFGHMIWVNPLFRLGTQQLAALVHESHQQGVLVVGQSASYSTFSATHPDMLKFIPTDNDKLSKTPHIEIRAMIVHNTDEIQKNLMQVFTACALEETCLSPPGAKWQCRFDFTGRKHADCHRFDESALNILLKNMFKFDTSAFARRNNYFRPYDPKYKPKLKLCRDVKDIRDSEL